MKTPANKDCNNFSPQVVLSVSDIKPNYPKDKKMKTPVSHNGKFNAIYKELSRGLFSDYTKTQLLEATHTLLETYKKDVRRDKSIVRETDCFEELNFSKPDYTDCFEELNFSEPDYSDLRFWFPPTEAGLIENNISDGVFIPDNYINKVISNYAIGEGVSL